MVCADGVLIRGRGAILAKRRQRGVMLTPLLAFAVGVLGILGAWAAPAHAHTPEQAFVLPPCAHWRVAR
ncbi:MAG: hypothetical protein GDA40_11360 [Rhodobacteraceae bacterium]|nr:hypothetical protein [Paracoccaceae bacterium]